MNISINNKEINKTDLLHFISQNKLSAIIFFRGQTKIGLKDAKEIIENLERDPNFYDGVNLKIKEIDDHAVIGESIFTTTNSTSKKTLSTQKKNIKGGHLIKNNNFSSYNIKLYLICSFIFLLIIFYLFVI